MFLFVEQRERHYTDAVEEVEEPVEISTRFDPLCHHALGSSPNMGEDE
jgi:hypothetical protein